MWLCAHEHRCPWKPKASDPLEPGLEAVVSCLPGLGAGSWVLCVNSSHIKPLSHLVSLKMFV